MKRPKLSILTMTCFALLVVSCGRGQKATDSTQTTGIGGGVSYEPYSDMKPQSTLSTENSSNTPPTAENIEGLQEVVITLAEDSVIYSKPQSNSAVIGSLDEGSEVGVYRETEDGKWTIVNYNGRIGYLLTENLVQQNNQRPEYGEDFTPIIDSTPVIDSIPVIEVTPDITPEPDSEPITPVDPEPIIPVDPEPITPIDPEPITPVEPEAPLPEGS